MNKHSETNKQLPCPKCNGSQYFEKVEGCYTLGHCFHASCGYKSRVLTNTNYKDLKLMVDKHIYDRTKPLESVAQESLPMERWLKYTVNPAAVQMINQYGFGNSLYEDVKLYYDPKENRLVFMIDNDYAIGRLLPLDRPFKIEGKMAVFSPPEPQGAVKQAKWYVYTKTPKILLKSTLKPVYKGVLVIVEDIISGLVVSNYCDTLTLGGTVLQNYHIEYLASVASSKYSKVLVCLDNDAFKKGITMAAKLGMYLPEVQARYLTKDMKNMSEREIINVIQGVNS